MKRLLAVLGLLGLVFAFPAYSGTLILSPQIKLVYEEPEHVAHYGNVLYLRYSDWYITHEVLDPDGGLYSKIDLTGVERDFLKSIFDADARSALAEWLAVLARQQAEVFGADKAENTDRREVGGVEVFGVHNPVDGIGHIYIFDETMVHWLSVKGTRKKYFSVFENIEVK